ncbi:MAG: hypothetical protein ACRCX5_14360 [Bacteroidales bacterium]|uniref:hypothetical protein n=1 Tax=Clostridium chrysemydis TaxID=2665504 RepID=UPI003F416B3D
MWAKKTVIININEYIICVDFGQGEDLSVQSTSRIKMDGSLEFIESKIIGKAIDYYYKEKRDKYIKELNNKYNNDKN